jgi:hypothetical protein
LTIRHHEVGTVEISEDPDLIDFLFYSYYNLIRFALLRLYAADSEGSAATPVPMPQVRDDA